MEIIIHEIFRNGGQVQYILISFNITFCVLHRMKIWEEILYLLYLFYYKFYRANFK